MADFNAILDESPYSAIHGCIDNFRECAFQDELADFRRQKPNMTLTPLLYYCVQKDKVTPFEQLLNAGIDPNEDVVEAAAEKDDERFLLELLQHGWPINKTLRGGKVPSLLCLVMDRPMLLETLLQKGANPNALSTSGETPLSAVVQTGTLESVRRLLEAGADVKMGDPLHYAVERETDAFQVVQLLLSHKAPVNTTQFADPSARQLRHFLTRGTPLHKACLLSKYEVAELLLEHGADPNSTRMHDSKIEFTTPLGIAKQMGDKRMITLLETVVRPDSGL
ncbi:hypothetical protein LTS10_013313 [Elasticomyces elasticus]|nr:hypothetical protein LTS10_013313 [Elasticomyces elasticus]